MVHTYIGLTDTSLEAKSYAYEYEISLEVKKLFQPLFAILFRYFNIY